MTSISGRTTGCPHDMEKQDGRALWSATPSVRDGSQTWMARLSDETFVNDITIPGTHDSAAYTVAVPFIATQDTSIRQQLDSGIRYLDLRCGLRYDSLEMVHGPQLLGILLEDLLRAVYDWLDEHPSEALMVQLKKDRKDEGSSVSFVASLLDLISQAQMRWRLSQTTPYLGDLRGRIQLFRRFKCHDTIDFGIDVSRWQDNPRLPFTIDTGHGLHVTIQDYYRFDDPEPLPAIVGVKSGLVQDLLRVSAEDTRSGRWYINFASALELNWSYQYPPKRIANGGWYGFRWVAGVNSCLLSDLLAQGRRSRLGIVAMDFPDATPGLVTAIYETNFDQSSLERLRVLCKQHAVRALLFVLVLYCLAVNLVHALSGPVHGNADSNGIR